MLQNAVHQSVSIKVHALDAVAAINGDGGARNVRRGRRAEKRHHPRDLHWLRHPAHRRPLQHLWVGGQCPQAGHITTVQGLLHAATTAGVLSCPAGSACPLAHRSFPASHQCRQASPWPHTPCPSAPAAPAAWLCTCGSQRSGWVQIEGRGQQGPGLPAVASRQQDAQCGCPAASRPAPLSLQLTMAPLRLPERRPLPTRTSGSWPAGSALPASVTLSGSHSTKVRGARTNALLHSAPCQQQPPTSPPWSVRRWCRS